MLSHEKKMNNKKENFKDYFFPWNLSIIYYEKLVLLLVLVLYQFRKEKKKLIEIIE